MTNHEAPPWFARGSLAEFWNSLLQELVDVHLPDFTPSCARFACVAVAQGDPSVHNVIGTAIAIRSGRARATIPTSLPRHRELSLTGTLRASRGERMASLRGEL